MVRQHNNGRDFEQSPGDGEGQGTLLQSMGSQRAGHDLVTKQLQDEWMDKLNEELRNKTAADPQGFTSLSPGQAPHC